MRERHEIERLVQPLLQHRPPVSLPENELDDPAQRALRPRRRRSWRCRTFSELAGGGALDRFRTLKRRLGDKLLHPRLLPAMLETTVAIKNRFRELWEDEEPQLLDDTNRVMELRKQLANHPEMVTRSSATRSSCSSPRAASSTSAARRRTCAARTFWSCVGRSTASSSSSTPR